MNDSRKGPTSEHEEGSMSDEQMEKSSRSGLDISYKRMGHLMARDFRITIAKLAQKGFEDEFIWDLVDRAELPNSCVIEKHFKQQVGEKEPEDIAFQMAVTRMMFAYLIQTQKALCQVLRNDEQFLQSVSDVYLEDLKKKEKENDTRASYLLQGYFLGQASVSIHNPEKFLDLMAERHSTRMSHAGSGKKGVVTSPASKAILLAFDHGYMTGEPVCHFFDGNSFLDEIDVEIELDDSGEERIYRFRGLDPPNITELSASHISVRVSQLKKKRQTNN